MPKFLSTANWPFAFKFTIPSLLALLLVVVIETVSLNALNVVKTSLSDVVEKKYNASLLLEQCVDRLRAVNGELYLLQTKKAAGFAPDVVATTKELSDKLGAISDTLIRFKATYARPQDIPRIDDAIENVRQYRKAMSFVGSMLDLDFKATVTFIVPLRDAYEAMINNLSAVSNEFLDASRKASMEADDLARKRTQFIFVFSFAVLAFSLAVMIPLAYSTVRSIKALAAATVRLADGDTRIDLEALRRSDELGRIVNALRVFRDNVERVATLKKVSLLYASMNAMLNSLKEGLFSFGPDGVCSDTYSKACVDLLRQTPSGRSVSEVLHFSAEERKALDGLLKLVFGKSETLAMPPQSLLDLLPKNFYESDEAPRNQEATISLAYRPIFNAADDVQSVLVIATDHSDALAAARLNEERQKSVLRILRILSGRNLFVRFFTSLTEFFAAPEKQMADSSLDQFKRDVHTFKGAAGIYYLDDVASALHDIETLLPENGDAISSIQPSLARAFEAMRETLANVRPEIVPILGEDFDKQGMIRTIPLVTIKQAVDSLPKTPEFDVLRLKNIQLLMGESVHNLLSNTRAELKDLADRYGKNLDPVRIEGEDFLVLSEAYAGLFSSLTHIARNIVKHGIEDPETRKKSGKPDRGLVVIRTEKFRRSDSDWFRLSFEDDGAGIDTARLKELPSIAHRKELLKVGRDELLQHVFDSDVSTASQVTVLGGRGVGLSAVKQAVEEVGGTVRIESVLHQSTKIVLEAPFVWDMTESIRLSA